MIIDIIYSKQAKKFLDKHSSIITVKDTDDTLKLAIRKLFGEDINIDVVKMRGRHKGKYRLRSGAFRIIFRIEKGIIRVINVEKIDFRGDVYKD